MEVDAVGLQGREDQVRHDGAVLVGLEDGEDGGQYKLDKVIQQALVVLLELNAHLARLLCSRAVGKVKEVGVERLLGSRLPALLMVRLGPAASRRQDGTGRRRRLEGAKGGNMRFTERGHIVDKHLTLSLDVDRIGRVSVIHELGRNLRVVCRVFARRAVEVKGSRCMRINRHGSVAVVCVGCRGRLRVREARRRAHRSLNGMRLLFSKLLTLDDGLDLFFLVAASIIVTPPDGSLVFTNKAKMLAGAAEALVLVALLSSKSASVASCSVKCAVSQSALKRKSEASKESNKKKFTANWRIVRACTRNHSRWGQASRVSASFLLGWRAQHTCS